jgi:RNA polymerase sigma factor (sigma-70 family)
LQRIDGRAHLFVVELETSEWPPSLIANYREHRLALVRISALILGSRGLAEEAVHDAVVAVHGRWDGLEHPGAYLRTAVVNRSREILRRQRPEWSISEIGIELPEGLVDLHRSLGRLPERQRVAVVLRFFVDLDDAEIADHLKCRPGTVRSLVSRALNTLRKEMDR